MSSIGQGRVVNYIKDRVDAFAETVQDAATKLSSEGFVGDAVQIVTSVFGVLPINEFGDRAQKRRERARKNLTGRY